jgi:hypothetical protein
LGDACILPTLRKTLHLLEHRGQTSNPASFFGALVRVLRAMDMNEGDEDLWAMHTFLPPTQPTKEVHRINHCLLRRYSRGYRKVIATSVSMTIRENC